MCSGTVFLDCGFIATGEVSFAGAQIGGDLVCDGGEFDAQKGNALICGRAVIKGSVFLRENFTSTGRVSLVNAKVGGSLECINAVFNNIDFDEKHVGALVCDRAVIKGSVFLRGGFVAIGTVRLQGTKISSDLECSGSTLDASNDFCIAGGK